MNFLLQVYIYKFHKKNLGNLGNCVTRVSWIITFKSAQKKASPIVQVTNAKNNFSTLWIVSKDEHNKIWVNSREIIKFKYNSGVMKAFFLAKTVGFWPLFDDWF